MSKLETVDRFFNGVAWGTSPRVIARKADGSAYLLWIPGCTSYVDRSVGRKYGASSLRLIRPSRSFRLGEELSEGGRLSKGLVTRFRENIDAVFGAGAADLITLKETLVLPVEGVA